MSDIYPSNYWQLWLPPIVLRYIDTFQARGGQSTTVHSTPTARLLSTSTGPIEMPSEVIEQTDTLLLDSVMIGYGTKEWFICYPFFLFVTATCQLVLVDEQHGGIPGFSPMQMIVFLRLVPNVVLPSYYCELSWFNVLRWQDISDTQPKSRTSVVRE